MTDTLLAMTPDQFEAYVDGGDSMPEQAGRIHVADGIQQEIGHGMPLSSPGEAMTDSLRRLDAETRIERTLRRLDEYGFEEKDPYGNFVDVRTDIWCALLDAIRAAQYLISECYKRNHETAIPWEAVEHLQDRRDALADEVLGASHDR